MQIKHLPARSASGNAHVFVEIPKGAHNKYELDSELGVIRFDRPLHSAVYYPTEYGFVPGTLPEDDEPLDCLVLIDEPTFPGCLIEARVVGATRIESASGRLEHKLLGVPIEEPRFAEVNDVGDVPEHVLQEIEHFFEIFKELEGRPVESHGWISANEAEHVLDEAISRFAERAGD